MGESEEGAGNTLAQRHSLRSWTFSTTSQGPSCLCHISPFLVKTILSRRDYVHWLNLRLLAVPIFPPPPQILNSAKAGSLAWHILGCLSFIFHLKYVSFPWVCIHVSWTQKWDRWSDHGRDIWNWDHRGKFRNTWSSQGSISIRRYLFCLMPAFSLAFFQLFIRKFSKSLLLK